MTQLSSKNMLVSTFLKRYRVSAFKLKKRYGRKNTKAGEWSIQKGGKLKKETKRMCNSESTSKIKVRLRWIFFKIFQLLFAFKKSFMKARLYNIFKSKIATKFVKPIIESSYKVLLDKLLFVTTIKRPVHFYGPLNF